MQIKYPFCSTLSATKQSISDSLQLEIIINQKGKIWSSSTSKQKREGKKRKKKQPLMLHSFTPSSSATWLLNTGFSLIACFFVLFFCSLFTASKWTSSAVSPLSKFFLLFSFIFHVMNFYLPSRPCSAVPICFSLSCFLVSLLCQEFYFLDF